MKIIAVFNVTSTSSPTQIMDSSSISNFSEIEVDGLMLTNIVSSYTFDTVGEHIIKYKLNTPTSIPNNVFSWCRNLKSITIPDGVSSIGERAFASCKALTSITIPDSVTSIGREAFASCEALTTITIPNGVTSIDYWTFNNCISLTSITIPDSVTSIGERAFSSCRALTSITIPDSVTSIGENCFASCGFTELYINAANIGYEAFSGCNIETVTFGPNVSTIGNYSFSRTVTTITSLAMTAPTIYGNTFGITNRNGTLYVPSGSTGYDAWMSICLSNLGFTKIEQ